MKVSWIVVLQCNNVTLNLKDIIISANSTANNTANFVIEKGVSVAVSGYIAG